MLPTNVSDHIPMYMVRKKEKDSYPKIEFEGRSYYNFDDDIFTKLLLREDWNFVYENKSLDEAWEGFHAKIEEILENDCPLKKFKFRWDKPDWISNELIEFIKDKDAALKRAAKTKRLKTKKLHVILEILPIIWSGTPKAILLRNNLKIIKVTLKNSGIQSEKLFLKITTPKEKL